MTRDDHKREYFRIPCELQLRFRKADAAEVKMFKDFGLRPSPYSALRMNIETELQRMSTSEETKLLMDRAFRILLNIDQRLERLEEMIQNQNSKAAEIQESHEWIHADLSAGGLAFEPESDKKLKVDDLVMMDMIFPSLPEHRVVCSGIVVHSDRKNGHIGIEFNGIHQDDQEFIHRFVMEREREILRTRALERDKKAE